MYRGILIAFIIFIVLAFFFIMWCCMAISQGADDNPESMGINFDDWDGV